jgi:hypothetical protein
MSEEFEGASIESLESEQTDEEGKESAEEGDFLPFDDFYSSFDPQPVMKVVGADGLPSAHVPEGQIQHDIPVLSPETLVCMGDYSEFRSLLDAPISKDRVEMNDEGQWIDKDTKLVVHPKRKPCEYYHRQIAPLSENPLYKRMYRLCTRRVNSGGAFMSLSDMELPACSLRTPRDWNSEKLLDEFDNEIAKRKL